MIDVNEETVRCINEITEQAKQRVLERVEQLTVRAKAIKETYTEQVMKAAEEARARDGERVYNPLRLIVEQKGRSLALRWYTVIERGKDKRAVYRRILTNKRAMTVSPRNVPADEGHDEHYSLSALRGKSPDYAHEAVQQAELYARRVREEITALNKLTRSLQMRGNRLKAALPGITADELRATGTRYDYSSMETRVREEEAIYGKDGRRKRSRKNFGSL